MGTVRWSELTRAALSEVLPEALVVLPIGSTEQHGPHLPTSTDITVAEAIAVRSAKIAAKETSRPLVLAPPLAFGASHHHLPFGGTLSLKPATLLAVLEDLLASMVSSGASRLVLLNGHGGNSGVCHAAAASVSAQYEHVTVAHVNYWALRPVSEPQVPGHAGRFETSLMLALRGPRPDVEPTTWRRPKTPVLRDIPGVEVHSQQRWRHIDGYSDDPSGASASEGARILAELCTAMAARLVDLAREDT